MISLHLADNDSPFLVLWYVYLAFLGAVIVAHVIFAAAARLLKRRTDSLLKIRSGSRRKL
jgi:hypothetical protein